MSQTLSIIMSAYNESKYIVKSIERVLQCDIPDWQKEVIVINDGSTDSTLQLIKKMKRKHRFLKIISSNTNKGKGYALMKGINTASGDIIVIQDADIEYEPGDFKVILKQYSDLDVKVVYGSRILGSKKYKNSIAGLQFYLGGRILTYIVNIAFGVKLTDQPTCYKSWRSELSQGLISYGKRPGFEFEIEMTAYFSERTQIKEVPIHYYPRSIEQGKKVKIHDFILSVGTILSCLLRRIKK